LSGPKIEFHIQSQPDDVTCGPTCLASVYRYFGDDLPLEQVIREIPSLEEGGTLAVLMGTHALRRGYQVRVFTYNLRAFDPSWFYPPGAPELIGYETVLDPAVPPAARVARVDLARKLGEQRLAKKSVRLQVACEAYIDFVQAGGEVLMHELNEDLLRFYLDRGVPVMTGLSATWLYRFPRQIGRTNKPDDVRGEPEGHFVVLRGYDPGRRLFSVADPWLPNPLGQANDYDVPMDRLVSSILLGVLTYDANLTVIEPASRRAT
jgi:Peptidase_C39 like family